jgi:hypothetical protein
MLTGLQRWRQATIAGLATGGLGVVATVTVLALGGGITGMFAVEAVTTTVALAWTATLARGAMSELQAEPTRALELRRGALRFAAFSFGGTLLYLIVWRRSEFFFLNHYSSDSEIAYYSIAFAIATGVVRLPSGDGRGAGPGDRDVVRRGSARPHPGRLQPRATAARARDPAGDGCGCGSRAGGDPGDLGAGVQPGRQAVPGHGRGVAADRR